MTNESMSYLEALKEIKRLKEAWGKVKEEINKIYIEEAEHDKRWAKGLKYSLKIIDKHLAGVSE